MQLSHATKIRCWALGVFVLSTALALGACGSDPDTSAQPDQPVAADREMIVGLHHVAFVVSTLEDLDEVFTRVSEYPGVEIEFSPQQNPVGVGPRVHFMFFEPGGNRVEMVCDPQ